ncbi:Hypothetical protein PHPALM_4447 [Phytophthora palmivora]|uniref:Uncharacterized protein n=1 Tax=Phytophthora palmivora TaxID=4796 RepID=A0A2P4YJW1_9STRA|nr:Hypothetical protein PHPALM_4447 [Phytophthora palmivora]
MATIDPKIDTTFESAQFVCRYKHDQNCNVWEERPRTSFDSLRRLARLLRAAAAYAHRAVQHGKYLASASAESYSDRFTLPAVGSVAKSNILKSRGGPNRGRSATAAVDTASTTDKRLDGPTEHKSRARLGV